MAFQSPVLFSLYRDLHFIATPETDESNDQITSLITPPSRQTLLDNTHNSHWNFVLQIIINIFSVSKTPGFVAYTPATQVE
jgi:hypothetical protein